MTEPDTEVRSQQGLDRIVFFSDAVVAIAITLVVLPLVDSARDTPEGAGAFLRENGYALVAAGISFAVIAGFWRDHHALFTRVTGYDEVVVRLNLLWLAGIVLMPVATVLEVAAPHGDPLSVGLYLGVIAATMIVSRLLAARVRAAGFVRGDLRPGARGAAVPWVPVALFLVVSAVALLIPSVGLYALLAMLFAPLLSRALAGGAR